MLGGMTISIKVIDAPCGAGKTSWAIQEINRNPDKSYVYCTPFLSEIERIKRECGGHRFHDPIPIDGRKSNGFNALLAKGTDIAVTHSTFLNADDETFRLLREGNYSLFLDEELNVVMDFNSIQTTENNSRQQAEEDDVARLIRTRMIEVDENLKVKWIDVEQTPSGKDYEVQRMAQLGRLYCVDYVFLVTVFPPEIFRQFDTVYVMSYLFDGSPLQYYLQLFKLNYEKASVRKDEAEYSLEPYNDKYDAEFRARCSQLIHMSDKESLKRRRNLTKSWYRSANRSDLRQLSSDLRAYFDGLTGLGATRDNCMWTCPTEFQERVASKGYTRIRSLTKEEKKLPRESRKLLEDQSSCFVPSNSRATNIYRNRWVLAYGCNMFYNPFIQKFFFYGGITIDNDAFALSCLLQWICRSRLRDGQEIHLYLPSARLRKILKNWMDRK